VKKLTDLDKVIGNKYLVFIESITGAGKTTFLKKLSDIYCAEVIFEPCDEWQNVNGHNLLQKFLSDMRKWAYPFQSYALLTRTRKIEMALKERNGKNLFFCERSIFVDYNMFGKTCYRLKNMSEIEWSLYNSWYEWLVKYCMTIPFVFVYLRVSPDIAYKRICKRARIEEKNFPISYLNSLYELHEEMFVNKSIKNSSFGINPEVLVLDWNFDIEKDKNSLDDSVMEICEFLKNNCL
jgi:deoxynucleoside kinase